VEASIGREDIEQAATRLSATIRRTPVLEVDAADVGTTGRLWLKLELLQHSGSFKARGAANAIGSTPVPAGGVLAASGGNHGAAVAWAAQRFGHAATIVVPAIAAAAKVARLRTYGARVEIVPGVYADALTVARRLAEQGDVRSVHAYDEPAVLAGAGTVGRELTEQVPGLDTVLVACGGGGLAGGIATWLGDATRLVVVEAEGTGTYAAAVAAGHPVDIEVTGLTADALGATRLGTLGWRALHEVGAPSVIVTDDEVRAARQRLWDTFRLVTEPAAAAALAALTSGAYRPRPGERVAVVLCGANTDPTDLTP
jgi:threonine dehydratase